MVTEKPIKNGRPPIADGEKTTVFAVRLTERQLQKVIKNGRSEWLRKLIDDAKE